MTLKEIAKRANVSLATVSRALNTPELVQKTKRDEILTIARENNYLKYRNQYSIIGKENEIGLIIPDICNPFFARVLDGICIQAVKSNLSLTLHLSHDNINAELNAADILINNGVKGIILVRGEENEIESQKTIKKIKKHKIPFVLIDRDFEDHNYSGVFLSNTNASYDATNFLINKSCKKIAMITGPEDNLNSSQRLAGYIEALLNNGIEVDNNLIFRGKLTIQSGFEITQKIITSDNLPDAIFLSTNKLTLGCIKAIKSSTNKSIQNIKIFSFNRIYTADIDIFKLNYIEHPVKFMGEKAVLILKNKLIGTKGIIRDVMSYKIRSKI